MSGRTTPPTIVDWFNLDLEPGEPVLLSEPSKTWVDRLWHANIDIGTSKESRRELNDLFVAYVAGLDDQQERVFTLATWGALTEKGLSDDWPKCPSCGMPLCPHCDGRHPHRETGSPTT